MTEKESIELSRTLQYLNALTERMRLLLDHQKWLEDQVDIAAYNAGSPFIVRLTAQGWAKEFSIECNTPHGADLIKLIRLILLHAQKENLAVLEEDMIKHAGSLAPLLGLSRTKLSDLDLPNELIRPRVIEPFIEENPS